ncbi:DNA-processing protein DprA [Streptomyces sp. 5K101]|uniref:DNA-processing protein DprA n=1 Tax=Streptomyces sp. 5K101 TaxID=3390037 RepID=UPI0039756248
MREELADSCEHGVDPARPSDRLAARTYHHRAVVPGPVAQPEHEAAQAARSRRPVPPGAPAPGQVEGDRAGVRARRRLRLIPPEPHVPQKLVRRRNGRQTVIVQHCPVPLARRHHYTERSESSEDLMSHTPSTTTPTCPTRPREASYTTLHLRVTRQCTTSPQTRENMAAALATGLAERGWVVVSGAAFGVDGAAHRGALAAGGATVAVLACGVDVGYPPGHTALIKRIVQQGLVVGELPPGDHPTRSRFVLRNRVIAALTRGTVVVEAEYRSGSLVTARRAQQLGRFTIGVPGPVTSGLSAGVHELLRGGAVLVTDAAEVVELVGDMGDLAPERTGPVLPRDLLDPRSRRVLEALPARRAVSCAEAARCAGTTEDEALGRLYELHSLGFVERCTEGWRLTSCARSGSNARRGDA